MLFHDINILNWGLVIPFLGAVLFLFYRYRRKMLGRYVESGLEPLVVRGFDLKRYVLKDVLLCSVFFLSVVALARPQWGFEWQAVSRVGLDITLVVDTSKSMLTGDVKPNRLERTKLAIRDLLKKLKGDRVGLVAFSGEAFMMCPLTSDYNGFLLSLDDLSVDSIPRGGTDIGRAIQEAIKGYKEVPSRYKAVVILTDGENLEGEPLRWAREARSANIRIYTVGIGTREGEMVRAPNDKGEWEFVKDSDGNFIKSRLNENLLKEIAALTQGAYVRASGAQFGLDFLYENELSRLEKRDIESQMDKRYDERFQIFVFLALLILILELIMPLKKVED
jgi:Ca-activated chloride channel family protein